MHLLKVALQLEGMRVTKRDVDDTVVGQGTERAEEGRLLSTTKASSRDEHASILASQLSASPECTGGVPQGL